MEHPQGERALLSRHLVVIQLRRVDGARAELVVLRERLEYGCQKDASWSARHVRMIKVRAAVAAA
jgi:hypothetical protein